MRFNQTFRTDTGQQISELNCKAEEEKDKKRAEVRKHQKF
ncbi:hypothetical protein V6Z12_A11G102000 [Gossypium hirsutum]